MRTIVLLFLLATTAAAEELYIPVAGVTPGQNGTFWRTDLRIHNPSASEEIDVTLQFLPQGESGENVFWQGVHVGRRGTIVLDNVVAALLPSASYAIGAIRLDAGGHHFVASSRTYTTHGAGSYGQFVPALARAEATAAATVLHVASSTDFRTNCGVMNPNAEAVTIRMTLLGTDGLPFLESAPRTVLPESMQQWSLAELFGGVFMLNGAVLVETTQPVFAWGSVIDNYSGDAMFVRGR